MKIKDLRALLNIPVTEDGYTDDTEVFIYLGDYPILEEVEMNPMMYKRSIGEGGIILEKHGKLALVFRPKR